MDQKTLEYMAERVDKARDINRRIKELEHFITYMEGKSRVHIHDGHGNGPRIREEEYKRLLISAKTAVLDAILEEIELLKQELEEI
ncbi:hypothetical protein [Paenibacillus lautus]|uniref:hypothetical protein n=1 Tax=Paenibacillus lautus TaxID=1401 RepID=UPI003D2CA20F